MRLWWTIPRRETAGGESDTGLETGREAQVCVCTRPRWFVLNKLLGQKQYWGSFNSSA